MSFLWPFLSAATFTIAKEELVVGVNAGFLFYAHRATEGTPSPIPTSRTAKWGPDADGGETNDMLSCSAAAPNLV